MKATQYFTYAAICLIIGGVSHIIGYFMGPEAVDFMGAPPETVQSMKDGTWPAKIACFSIAGLLFVLALLCLNARPPKKAGKIARVVLIVFSLIFTLRGLLVVLFIPGVVTGNMGADPLKFWFHVFASLFVLSIGLAMTKGLVKTAGPRNEN